MIGFPLQLPIDSGVKRRWFVGQDTGDVFLDGEDFDGLTVTIELHGAAEVRAVAAAMMGQPVAIPLPQERDAA